MTVLSRRRTSIDRWLPDSRSRSIAEAATRRRSLHPPFDGRLTPASVVQLAVSLSGRGPGLGKTQDIGDEGRISSLAPGALVNRVDHCDAIAPWTFRPRALMGNPEARGVFWTPPGSLARPFFFAPPRSQAISTRT